MSSRLFVGNLPYDATEEELREHFSQAGPVTSVFIPLDRETSRSRGFAFIEFGESAHAAAAISQLHQKAFRDRPLVVNEARPNEGRATGPPRSAPGGGRPPSLPRPAAGASEFGDESRDRSAIRRSSPAKPRRGRGKRGGWDDAPRKEPIPEKRRGQIFGGYDDPEEEDEDVDFENFATSLPESGDPEEED